MNADVACPVCAGVPVALPALRRGHGPGEAAGDGRAAAHVQRAPLQPAAAGQPDESPAAAQRGVPDVHRSGVPPAHRTQRLHEHRGQPVRPQHSFKFKSDRHVNLKIKLACDGG